MAPLIVQRVRIPDLRFVSLCPRVSASSTRASEGVVVERIRRRFVETAMDSILALRTSQLRVEGSQLAPHGGVESS
jgi:hypothetical protein